MAKHFLTDDIIEHIQDGYYATHEQDLSEEQVHELSEEQLHYYNKQGKAYRIEQKKKRRLITIGLVLATVLVVAIIAVVVMALNSGEDLYDPNSEEATTSEDTSTPGLIQAPERNTRAGAQDNAAQ